MAGNGSGLPTGGGKLARMQWSDEIDEIIGGDLTAGLAYVTPAGGAVVTAVAPIGLRDREAGTVTFTTSLGLDRKLERIRRNPQVALAYHAREHGFSDSSSYVLVQGRATFDMDPDEDYLRGVVSPAAERFMGPPKEGRLFWDRWLREYYRVRIPVQVQVDRIVRWLDLACQGEPEVLGKPLPDGPPEPQRAPKKGAGPRVDAARAARRLGELPHRLAAWRDADGYPMVLPFALGEAGEPGIAITAPAGTAPPGERRAGLLSHDYRAALVGLRSRQYTGWLDGHGLYAPHTETGFRAPANKTLLLLANGLLAKRGLRKAQKAA
jgi:Pyridoxamine 5'-phosphate oxidase